MLMLNQEYENPICTYVNSVDILVITYFCKLQSSSFVNLDEVLKILCTWQFLSSTLLTLQ